MHHVVFVGVPASAYSALESRLRNDGFAPRWYPSAAAAVDLADAEVLVVDGQQAADLVPILRDGQQIILAGTSTAADALALHQRMDVDYLVRLDDPDLVELRIRRALRHRQMAIETQIWRQRVTRAGGLGDIIGTSPPMQEMFELIEQAAATTASVLITGESGTGKELIARALHARGPRKDRPFVAINCSAVPETLLESELFGHVRGAFTDAHATRTGLFVRAAAGTLFLDEVGDMPITLQPKLLRALQERVVRPVGGDHEISVDVRIITATHHDLERAVAAGRFREDLFYRINVIHVPVPPLRDRAGDILVLARHFIDHYAAALDKPVSGLSRMAADRLIGYSWPGNVRELQNAMERAVALTRDDEVQLGDLPPRLRDARPPAEVLQADDLAEMPSLDEVEKRYIVQVMERAGGNKKDAARILGIDRKTLYRKLARFGLAGAPPENET